MIRALLTACVLAGAVVIAGCPDDRCCTSDNECAAGAVCFEGSCAQRCTVDAQCLEGQKCAQSVCIDPLRSSSECEFVDAETPWTLPGADGAADAGTPPDCQDSLEPNDEPESAHRVFVPGEVTAELCPGDEDWFAVNVNAGQTLTATLAFDNQGADLDLEILRYRTFADLAVEAASQGVTAVEEASVTPTFAGVYYVRVFAFDDAAAPYVLNLALSDEQGTCVDDALEENDGRYFASDLDEGLTDATICPFDVDVFHFQLEGADTVVEMVEPSPQLQPQMWGYSPQWGAVSNGGVYAAALPGDYFVVVAPLESISSNLGMAYTLSRIELPPSDCMDNDDGNEPNDVRSAATPVDELPAQELGMACARSPDFFRVAWPANETQFNVNADGDVQLAVFEGERLLRAIGPGMPWVDFAAPSGASDEFYVVVTAPPGRESPYALWVE